MNKFSWNNKFAIFNIIFFPEETEISIPLLNIVYLYYCGRGVYRIKPRKSVLKRPVTSTFSLRKYRNSPFKKKKNVICRNVEFGQIIWFSGALAVTIRVLVEWREANGLGTWEEINKGCINYISGPVGTYKSVKNGRVTNLNIKNSFWPFKYFLKQRISIFYITINF